MKTPIAAAGCALLAAAVMCSPSTAAASGPERADPAARCLWAKRDCYPPARLWYRVKVKVKATRSHETVIPGRPTENYDAAQTWELESNHAVRLTLGCVDVSELGDPKAGPRRPFLVKRRINGKPRTIGGCGKHSADLKPSVRFRADARGDVNTLTAVTAWDMWSDGVGNSCSSKDEHQALNSAQGLDGAISTASSLSEGLVVEAAPTGPDGNVHLSWSPQSCDFRGYLVSSPAREADRNWGPTDLLGGDPQRVFYDGEGWRAAWKYIRFPVRAGNFGEDYIVQKAVGQPQLPAGSFPPPPSGSQVDWFKWDYVYTIRLEACPRQGLDVERC